MEIIFKISNVIFLYKNLLNKMQLLNLNFEDAALLYCIKIGKNRICLISDFLEKDKSYVHRKLISLIKKDLVIKKKKEYLLSYKGIAIYKKLSLFNNMLKNECRFCGFDSERFSNLIVRLDQQIKEIDQI